MGASLFTIGGILAYNGIITGGIPKDKNLRRQKFEQVGTIFIQTWR